MRRILLIALSALAAACAGAAVDRGPTTTSAPTPATASPTTTSASDTAPTADLPPYSPEELVGLLEPIAAPLGFIVTRASLVDLASYRAAPDGTHLAVYVVPIREFDAEDHAAAYVPLAAAFLPGVFERWSGLESFDICQEPYGWGLDSTPPSVTLLDLDRAAAESIDWGSATLGDLIRRSREATNLTVTASADIAASDTWASASAG